MQDKSKKIVFIRRYQIELKLQNQDAQNKYIVRKGTRKERKN